MPYICIDNMGLVKVYVRLIKSSLVFVLVECGQLAALFFCSYPNSSTLYKSRQRCFRLVARDNLENKTGIKK